MAGGNLSPRQKMINLMYLVFIAMMAMQIGREVLRSFDRINTSMVRSNGLSTENNDAFMGIIEKRAQDDPEYVEVKKNADEIRTKAKNLVDYLGSIKQELDNAVGFNQLKPGEEPNYNALQNSDAITKILFLDDNKPSDKGEKLVTMIKDFNAYLKSVGKSQFIINIDDVKSPSEGSKSWLNENFYGQPMIASKTILTKIQSDVITAEGEIMRSFLTTKIMDDLEINAFRGVLSSPGYITKGTTSNVFAALGAFDNRVKGTAIINGNSYPVVDGQATIPISGDATGVKTLSGYMTFVDTNTGEQKKVEFDPVQYEVVDAVIAKNQFMAAVSADKMNVLYIGLDNPITASVTGVEPSTISISGPGVVNKGSGKASVKPSGGGKMNITVSGRTKEGKTLSQSFEFRVKSIPKPEGYILRKNTLSLPASALQNQLVEVGWQDFVYDLKANVTGFSVRVPGRPTGTYSGNSLGAASSLFGSLKPGDIVSVFDIKSRTTEGVSVTNAATITINIR